MLSLAAEPADSGRYSDCSGYPGSDPDSGPGCSDYPDCHFTENISFGNHNIDYGNCPKCGYPLVKKEGVRMIFCSKAGCNYIRLWWLND